MPSDVIAHERRYEKVGMIVAVAHVELQVHIASLKNTQKNSYEFNEC